MKKKTSINRFLFSLMLLLLMALQSICYAQEPKYGDKNYYLIDSLNLSALSENNRQLIDSCLEVYHGTSEYYVKLNSINRIVSECLDVKVWPKYNEWVYEFVLKKLASMPPGPIIKDLKIHLAGALNNMGFIHRNYGNIPLALEYYHKSLKIIEQSGNKNKIAVSYNNIGFIYSKQKDYTLALKYYHKSLNIREQIGDSSGLANSFINIGIIHHQQGENSVALEYYKKSLKIREDIGDNKGMAYSYQNIGSVFADLGDYFRALVYYQKSLKIKEQLEDKKGMATCYHNIGKLKLEVKALAEAKEYGFKGFKLAVELGFPAIIELNAGLLSKVALQQGNYKEAYEMRNLEIQMRDSLASEEAYKSVANQQAKYEYEKSRAINEKAHEKELEKQQALAIADKKRQNVVITSVSGGLILVILFSIFLFNRFRVIKGQKNIIQNQKQIVEQQKQEVENQKNMVEEKNKEILDSIHYAKRIQDAILPSLSAMQDALGKSFVLYKPKDVVAGDFYWMEKYNNKVFIAAADCTGHGVPGALVSVVCSSALTKALMEEGIADTGKLLDKTRELVIDRFARSDKEVKDGMDISLCAIDFNNNQMEWSGANNSLWIIRNGALMEYKANKQPIGVHTFMEPFTTHIIELEKNDFICLFTDGYQDQFGGEKGKKFKTAQLKEKILTIQNESIDNQREALISIFESWKGKLEQVDDVCIIGVKI